jgi:hypothetical protein
MPGSRSDGPALTASRCVLALDRAPVRLLRVGDDGSVAPLRVSPVSIAYADLDGHRGWVLRALDLDADETIEMPIARVRPPGATPHPVQPMPTRDLVAWADAFHRSPLGEGAPSPDGGSAQRPQGGASSASGKSNP